MLKIPPPPPIPTHQKVEARNEKFRVRTPRKWNDYRFQPGNISEAIRSERVSIRSLMKSNGVGL